MADQFVTITRAQAIIGERLDRYFADLEQSGQGANGAPQQEKRAAYEQVQQAPLQDFPAARAAFDQQYGPEEWGRQSTLQQRREPPAQG